MSDSTAWIALRSAQLSVEINPLGAQLSILRDSMGRDLLWNGDPALWAGRAPVLFPIVGSLAGGRYRVGERTYALPRHGFARNRAFQLLGADDSTAHFRLSADEQTRQVYPFNFQFDVSFAVRAAELSVVATVRNTDSVILPASIGYHPGLRWPLPYVADRADHYIEFDQPEPGPIRRLNADGLLTSEPHVTPVAGRRLAPTDALFQDDVVIFENLRSRSLTYGASSGPRIRISYPDATYLGVWTRPGAPFLCIEPWRGIADAAGFAGELQDKPGMLSIAPGAEQSLTMKVSLQPT